MKNNWPVYSADRHKALNTDITALLEQAIIFERAKSPKRRLAAKLKAGKLNKALIPERIQREIKQRAK